MSRRLDLLESDIAYAEHHLSRAKAIAEIEGQTYPDDYLRLVAWLDDAYVERDKLISESIEKQMEEIQAFFGLPGDSTDTFEPLMLERVKKESS